jgi:hypothetical protein
MSGCFASREQVEQRMRLRTLPAPITIKAPPAGDGFLLASTRVGKASIYSSKKQLEQKFGPLSGLCDAKECTLSSATAKQVPLFTFERRTGPRADVYYVGRLLPVGVVDEPWHTLEGLRLGDSEARLRKL